MRTCFSSRSRGLKALVLGAALALTAASAAAAQEGERPRFKDSDAGRSLDQRVPVTIDAPNARLAVLIRAPDGVVVMKKGVQNVHRIATGVYCIRPEAATGIDPTTAVAVVSVEYFYSLFNEVTVQWARRQSGCGNNRIGIYTFSDENLDGVFTPSNAAGFVVYVP